MNRSRLSIGLWFSAVLLLQALGARVGAQALPQFVRGDCNNDRSVDISDAVFLLIYNFRGGTAPSCLDACDFNDDGAVTGQVTDPVYLLRFSFAGGPVPPSPGPSACGPDPTGDSLDCQSQDRCAPPLPDPCPIFDVSLAGGQRNAEAAVAPSGNFVVVWEDDRDSDGEFQVRAMVLAPDRTQILDPFDVNVTGSGQQVSPALALNDAERFVVVWEDDANSNGLFEIRARGLRTDGTEVFAQFDVNVFSAGQQSRPDVAMDGAGNFVVVWEDDRDENGLFQVHARGFNPDGTERIPQFTVNTRSAGQQRAPAVAMDPATGAFVVVWEHDGDKDGRFDIEGRGFLADGTERLPEFTVNASGSGQQIHATVAMDRSGNFVAVWEDDRDEDGFFELRARGFHPDGSERIAQFTVNVFSAGQQLNPALAMDRAGNFAVAWEDDRDSDGEFHVRVRGFAADGAERFPHVKADCIEPAQHVDPAVALGESGRVLLFWDEIDATESVRVVGRIYDEPPPAAGPP